VCRDVNFREIAFPGRESQLAGLDRDSRFCPSTYFYLPDRSWIAGAGGRSPAGSGAIPRPMTGPHRRLLTSNIAGSGAPKMAGGRVRGSATQEAQRPSDDVPGNHRLPPWTSLVDVVVSRAGWVRETAGNGRVSGAVAHLSISRRAARQRDAIADRMPGMGDHSAFFLCIQNRWVAVWGQT